MPDNPVDDLTDAVKDVAYVAVGFGVMGFQRLQVKRHELTRAFNGQVAEPKGALEVLGAAVGERVKLVEERLNTTRQR